MCVCRCRMYSFMGGGLFCAGVGNILLIVSTATDYWMQYRQSSNYMHQGLWRYCMPGKCFPHNDSIGKTEIFSLNQHADISESWSWCKGRADTCLLSLTPLSLWLQSCRWISVLCVYQSVMCVKWSTLCLIDPKTWQSLTKCLICHSSSYLLVNTASACVAFEINSPRLTCADLWPCPQLT